LQLFIYLLCYFIKEVKKERKIINVR